MTADPDQSRRPRRGWHPPLTDFPIAAYVFAAAFDVISTVGGQQHSWAREFWHAGTFVLIAGGIICVLTVLAGFRDLFVLASPDSMPVSVISAHVCVMAGVFMIGVADIAWRLKDYRTMSYTPPGILACTLIAAIGVCVGAAYGGSLVFRHSYGVTMPGHLAGASADAEPGQARFAPDAGPAARHRTRRDR
jgi:uncharacterized membrane protein